MTLVKCCLLYTSDAADEEDSVDLGGRRIIKKKFSSAEAAVTGIINLRYLEWFQLATMYLIKEHSIMLMYKSFHAIMLKDV